MRAQGEECYIVHFTYGMDYDRTGRMVHGKKGDWHWDKRDYTIRLPSQVSSASCSMQLPHWGLKHCG